MQKIARKILQGSLSFTTVWELHYNQVSGSSFETFGYHDLHTHLTGILGNMHYSVKFCTSWSSQQ